MVEDKLLSMLGLCKKAGKLTSGFDPVAEKVAQGYVSLIVLARDLSPKSEKEIRRVADKYNVKICGAPFTMEQVMQRTGRRCGILGVCDKELAKAVGGIMGCNGSHVASEED